MSEFDISFIVDDAGEPPPGCRIGEVYIKSLRERFVADVIFWQPGDYEKQWVSAASRILTGDKTAMIVSLPDPSSANFVRWWAMYRDTR